MPTFFLNLTPRLRLLSLFEITLAVTPLVLIALHLFKEDLFFCVTEDASVYSQFLINLESLQIFFRMEKECDGIRPMIGPLWMAKNDYGLGLNYGQT